MTETLLERLAGWAAGMSLDDVPAPTVALARSQVLSQLAAVRAGMARGGGRRLVSAFGPPLQRDVHRSAMVLAGLGSWLHFDDTAYAGHLSNSTVAIPLAYAHAFGLDGRAVLTAVIAANECAARITAAATLGPFRGQLAAHTNLAGAIAGRLRGENAPAGRWVDAFGLAFSLAPWHLSYGYLSSDARLLGSLAPVRLGLTACDAATAGLQGSPDILEHREGFLARFATVPLPEVVTDGLGERWHTDTLSFKVHPSGPGSDAAVDCAIELHRDLGPVDASTVDEIEVHVSKYTVLVDRAAAAHVSGPGSPLAAILSTASYAVATALLTGRLEPADFDPPALADDRRWRLAAKVRLIHDETMSDALLASVAPFGAAVRQAGERAEPWLSAMGVARPAARPPARPEPGDDGFTAAEKATPAKVVLRLSDGTVRSRRLDVPVGAAGSPTRADHAALMREKYLGTGGADREAAAALRLDRLSAAELRDLLTAALR